MTAIVVNTFFEPIPRVSENISEIDIVDLLKIFLAFIFIFIFFKKLVRANLCFSVSRSYAFF